jgi:hypothetical protein
MQRKITGLLLSLSSLMSAPGSVMATESNRLVVEAEYLAALG